MCYCVVLSGDEYDCSGDRKNRVSSRADYEDQVVLPVDDKGLVIQSFAKDSKEGKRLLQD